MFVVNKNDLLKVDLICFCLLHFPDGVLRLAGAKSSHEGLLEVYYNGQWGTVCDDGWTELNTYVVCRLLGFK